MKTEQKDRYYLQSLANGILALEIISESDRPVSLSEIANQLSTNKTTATRICHTLSELHLLQKNEHNKYSLTPKILKFGYASLSAMGWRGIAKYYLEQLSEELQETASLSVLEGINSMFVLRIRKGDFFPFEVGIGAQMPAHCTAMGKVMVAFLSLEKKKALLEKVTFRPLTVHSIDSLELLVKQLDKIKQKGYAVNYEEVSIGVCGVAAPIIDSNGEAIAAISISSSTGKYSRKELEENLAPAIVQKAKEISEALAQVEFASYR